MYKEESNQSVADKQENQAVEQSNENADNSSQDNQISEMKGLDEIKAQIEQLSNKLNEKDQELASKLEENARLRQHNEKVIGEKRGLQDKYKDLDDSDIEEFMRLKEARKKDAIINLAMEGKVSELEQIFTQNQKDAFSKKEMEYEERLSVISSEKDDTINKLHEAMENIETMRRKQYLKDIVINDDTFKGNKPNANSSYWNQFEQIYANKMQFGEGAESGKVFALGDNGLRLVGADGKHVTFDQFIENEKASGGLFWDGGSGSGMVAGPGNMAGKPIKQMTLREKTEYKKQIGEKAFNDQLLKEYNNKG